MESTDPSTSVLANPSDNAPNDTVRHSSAQGQPAPAGSEVDPTPLALPHLMIGKVEVGFPVVQAALSGYSDWPMRMLAREHGASYSLCEVMLDQFLVNLYSLCEVMLDQFLVNLREDRSKNKHFLHNTEAEKPVAGQLMGSEPEQFSQGASRLAEAGFDVIDINFGCPVKKVLGRCRGGFHLSQPDVALEIIKRTRDTVPADIPVSVKMRRGIDDTQESRDKFFEILEGGFEYGLAAATVHGRTVVQRYKGPSRWSFLKELKAEFPNRVILGSGDLFTAQDCIDMMVQTGVDGVTVARGAIGNPWIFEQARALADGLPLPGPPTVLRQRKVLERHWELATEIYGPDRTGKLLRKFGIKYSASHPNFDEVRPAFTKIREFSDWQAVLDQWYVEDLPGRYPPPEIHRVQGSTCNE